MYKYANKGTGKQLGFVCLSAVLLWRIIPFIFKMHPRKS